MDSLNVIGAGKLGRTLARAWHQAGTLAIGGVLCREPAHAAEAVAFIGAGTAAATLMSLPAARWWLIATPDDAIAGTAAQLAESGLIRQGDVVFHASGVLDAAALRAVAVAGASTGSLHPALSFAEPARALQQLPGTPCAIEGAAAAELEALARALGGQPFRLAPGGKACYHAATVFASNYLVTLTALAAEAAMAAGLTGPQALALLAPLMRQTLDNALALGPERALTGPIARGDVATVASHLAALPPTLQPAYRALGHATVALAADRLPTDAAARLDALLAGTAPSV
ncbi:Rossmann-like and DUF2520 domain-containing protein [Chitinolyticbacter albus]|uniref:Rossmann-like and DUF2520 domain-containing protein n=1 Tax=Chitinolyticbacter albus TaxID=2961951 RepID=UPI00210E5A7F|nr:Rossmann-like and DUF2520 domain-containing protein [Chitinolyticbacter albus]